MYDYDYMTGQTAKAAANVAGTLVWTIIAIVIAIAAGIMVYFMFVKSDKPVSSSLQKLRDLLDFKTMLIEPILKVVYITLTIFIVLFSFGLISTSFVAFLMTLIFGPLIIRITYELMKILNQRMQKKKQKLKNKSQDLFFLSTKKRAYALPEYFPSLVEIIIFSPSLINNGTFTT